MDGHGSRFHILPQPPLAQLNNRALRELKALVQKVLSVAPQMLCRRWQRKALFLKYGRKSKAQEMPLSHRVYD